MRLAGPGQACNAGLGSRCTPSPLCARLPHLLRMVAEDGQRELGVAACRHLASVREGADAPIVAVALAAGHDLSEGASGRGCRAQRAAWFVLVLTRMQQRWCCALSSGRVGPRQTGLRGADSVDAGPAGTILPAAGLGIVWRVRHHMDAAGSGIACPLARRRLAEFAYAFAGSHPRPVASLPPTLPRSEPVIHRNQPCGAG